MFVDQSTRMLQCYSVIVAHNYYRDQYLPAVGGSVNTLVMTVEPHNKAKAHKSLVKC